MWQNWTFSSVQFSRSVTSDSLWPHGLQHARLPVLHPLLELAHTHDHWVDDAVQPSHPLSSPSPSVLIEKQRIREVWSDLTQGCTARRWRSRNSNSCLSDANAWEPPITPQWPFIALTVCQALASKAWKRCMLLFCTKPWEKDAVIFISEWLT